MIESDGVIFNLLPDEVMSHPDVLGTLVMNWIL